MGGMNKRVHLIRTGQELIWSRGYDRCSIKDITSAAGLPKGSFYHYFESKEKFVLEAMHDYLENFQEVIADTSPTLATLEKVIDTRIAAVVKIQFARECYMSVMCHAYSDQDDGFRKEVLAAIDQSNQSMTQLLEHLKKNQEIGQQWEIDELQEFIDFAWRGARLKARMLQADRPLQIFKKYLLTLLQTN